MIFGRKEASLEQVWTLYHTPDEFSPISSGIKECSDGTDNPKTDIVVPIVRSIVVAIGRATIPRIIVPRAATFICLSHILG